MPGINIEVGPWLFSFENLGDWLRSSYGRFKDAGRDNTNAISVDSKGVICRTGEGFRAATYPVKVYALTERGW